MVIVSGPTWSWLSWLAATRWCPISRKIDVYASTDAYHTKNESNNTYHRSYDSYYGERTMVTITHCYWLLSARGKETLVNCNDLDQWEGDIRVFTPPTLETLPPPPSEEKLWQKSTIFRQLLDVWMFAPSETHFTLSLPFILVPPLCPIIPPFYNHRGESPYCGREPGRHSHCWVVGPG